MGVISSPVKCQFALVCLDDIIIFSKTADEHIEHVSTVLSLVHRAGIRLNFKKGRFITGKIDCLGHVIRPSRFKLASYTTDTIRDLKLQKNSQGAEGIFRLMYLTPTLRTKYFTSPRPVMSKLKKGDPKQFDLSSKEKTDTLASLQELLIAAPVLALP